MSTDKALLLSAILEGIEVECDVENGKWRAGSQYFVRISRADSDEEVAKSTKSKLRSSVLKWDWKANDQIWFEPSSTLKAALYRVSRTHIDRLNDLVGQYKGKVVELLDRNASFDLTDGKGNPVPAKMKIVLSPTSESDDDIKKLMEKVDADVSRLPSNDSVWSTVSTVGKTLQLTKNIMDNLSKVHPILNASWTILSSLYQAVQETDLQDESVRDLARTLREMLATANKFRNLEEILNMPNVVEEIGHQSIQVASLIHEYAKLSFARRTGEIQIWGLKPRIEKCQKSCAALKVKLSDRINVDTNTRVKKIEDRQLAAEISKWLSAPDSSRFHNEAHEKREADTCSWFLNSERFIRWLENPGFLWVKGKPGCGKSILCSSIIDELPKPDSSLGIAYFFFDGRDGQTDQQLHNKLIRSLISQLSDMRHGGIPMKLVNLYENCGGRQPLDYQLQDTLRDILNGFSNVYIVIDALDECTDREKTLNWVNELAVDTDGKVKNLHILVTSRPLRDIEEVFGRLDPHSINVDEATENQDIMEYLKLQINLKSTFKKYDKNTQKKIESELAERAEGSFRWVALQLAELGKCASTTEIADQLAKLPKGLDETYNRILRTIDENHRAHTRTFLQWLAFSKCPMTISEIAETVTVDFTSDGPVFISGNRYPDPRDVLTRCSSLVSESEGTLRLSHFSVKEYLLSAHVENFFRISEKPAHSRISEISIAYLLQFNSFEPLTDAMLDNSPLARYAAEHWINHAKSGGMESELVKLISQFFTSETAPFTNWARIWNIDSEGYLWDPCRVLSMDRDKVCSPLYYASLAGMQQVLHVLLQRGENANAKGEKYGNALQAASYVGHKGIINLLLEKGANINAQGGYYGNALQAASYKGHKGIVNLLLDKGANVNAQGGTYDDALRAALSGGHQGIVNLLLEKGANIHAQGGFYGNALQLASYSGHKGIVSLLLEKGANINAQGGLYGNALQAASSPPGHEEIVNLLLEKGANVNAQGGFRENALQAASYAGHERIVNLLLKKGANVNAQGGYYGNALQAASYEGHEGIVNLLLENGANVNAQGGHSGNALQAALFGVAKFGQGHEGIVNLLLEKGAQVNELAISRASNPTILKLLMKAKQSQESSSAVIAAIVVLRADLERQ